MSSMHSLGEIGFYFVGLSLMAIGGANVVIPDMHRQFVDVWKVVNSDEFASFIALSQLAPGPNVLIVSLLGWKMAGAVGALVAMAGMCIPSSLVTLFFARFWQRFQQARWREVIQTGLVSVTMGLVLSSGYVLTRAADHSFTAYVITAITVIIVLKTRISPLWLLALAGILGYFGAV